MIFFFLSFFLSLLFLFFCRGLRRVGVVGVWRLLKGVRRRRANALAHDHDGRGAWRRGMPGVARLAAVQLAAVPGGLPRERVVAVVGLR